jgi:hypothetical protein
LAQLRPTSAADRPQSPTGGPRPSSPTSGRRRTGGRARPRAGLPRARDPQGPHAEDPGLFKQPPRPESHP